MFILDVVNMMQQFPSRSCKLIAILSEKCSIFAQFFVYPFNPRPLKNLPIHDMVTLQPRRHRKPRGRERHVPAVRGRDLLGGRRSDGQRRVPAVRRRDVQCGGRQQLRALRCGDLLG